MPNEPVSIVLFALSSLQPDKPRESYTAVIVLRVFLFGLLIYRPPFPGVLARFLILLKTAKHA